LQTLRQCDVEAYLL